MRYLRIKLEEAAVYHVMSRVIEHRFIFGDIEKDYMSGLMRRLEAFTACKIRTYVFLDNHFHILLYVPARVDISDDEVKRRVRILYGKKKYAIMEQNWALWEERGCGEKVKAQLDSFRVRMYDLSQFMKTFKQRLSIYYNANAGRRGEGPLWHDRFKSVLVEENEYAQVVVAAYIDLNPVRAGIVKDPKDYRWCGYAEAVAKGGASVDGLAKLFVNRDLKKREVLSEYRQNLYLQGAEKHNALTGDLSKPGFKREVVNKILDEGGRLPLPELVHCRVRYFSDGVIIGSKEFIEKMFNEHGGMFSKLRRKRGANQMKSGEWGDLCAACEIRSKVVAAPE